MSLWSPVVDLVNGSGKKQNLTNGNSQNYQEMLGQLNAKLFASQLQQSNLTEDEKAVIYNQLLQNSFQNKNRLINPSSELDSNASNNQQTNRNMNDNQRARNSNNSNQSKGMPNNKSNQRNNVANSGVGQSNMASSSNNNSSKRSNNNLGLDPLLVEQLFNQNAKKMKTNHQQANPQVQALQQQIQLQLAQQLQHQKQLEQQQQQQLQLQQQLQQHKQQQLIKQIQKQQQANIKKNEQMNKSQQQQQQQQLLLNQQALALAALTGGDVPLDLCVNNSNKKSDLATLLTNQMRQKQQMLANLAGNNNLSGGINNTNNNDLISQLENEQLREFLRQKRGRKPKPSTQTSESLIQQQQQQQQPSSSSSTTSFNQQQQTSNASSSNFDLFNNTRESPINQNSSSLLVDNRPRKRGRPSSTSTSNLSNSNQQNHQNHQNNNLNTNQLSQLLTGIMQANPDLVNTSAGKQLLLPILSTLQNNINNNNNRNNNTSSNNNGINQQDLIAAQANLVQQQINQHLKVMQAKMLLSHASSSNNNRQQQQTSSSAATNSQHQKNKNLNDSNLSHLSTGNVVIEEIKQRDHLDSEESDLEMGGKDQITFIRNYDERNLRMVFPFGWRRQTVLKSVSKSGVRGDVFYISPCGKKFKNFSEVDKYLMKANKNNLRKEHFNFSSRIVIGEFLEQLSDKNNDFKIYSEAEIINRIESIRRSGLKKASSSNTIMLTSTNSAINRKELNNQSANKKSAAINHNSAIIEANNKEIEKNRQLAEAKLKEEMQKQKKAKEEEAKRLLEQQKELELKRKKELALQAELERERRKQNQVLVRILESNRRIMDRDKKLTSFTNERRLQQDRRNLKKRIESEIQKEIKKPVEDMMLKDLNNLQTLNRIPGLKLSGKAFADLLMIYEFLNNFYECINLDKDRIPTLNTLQSALLNLDEAAEIEMMEILQHLLTIAIDDPGIPYNANTLVGQKLKDITINSLNISEVLKMYFQSYVSQIREDSLLDRVEYKIFNILDTGKPYLSLNASIKVEILAFICNELLCNQTITKKIEDRIESASNVKRDKWVIENDLRKYKLLKVKREKREDEIAEEKARNAENKNKENADKDEEDSDSDHDSQVYGNEIDGEDQLTNAEIDKNIEKLTKSVNNQSNKLNKIVNSYRVTSFGQDRFRRRYWSLPNAGAVFVESMESGEIDENLKLLEEEDLEDESCRSSSDEEDNNQLTKKKQISTKSTSDEMEVDEIEEIKEIKEEEIVNNKFKEEIVKEEKIEDLILSTTRSSRSSTRRKNDEQHQHDKDEHKTDKAKSDEDTKNEENNQNESVEDKKENGENQLDEQEIKSEMPNYMDLLNSEWIQSIIENVYSNYPSQNNFSSSSLVKKTTVLPGLEFLTLNQQQQTRQVFNILPRTSCSVNIPDQLPDFSSMSNDKDDELMKTQQLNDDKQQDLNLYKINDVLILPQELDIDATLQSQLIELKKLEYSRPKRIDDEYRYGWWNITDTSQLRQVAESMHERAHRERNLKKHILKYFNNLAAKIRQNNVEFDITDLDRIISIKCPFGAPVQPDEEWCEDTALKLDILVLEMVENLEETISSSSMQIRNWKPMPRTENDKEFICYPLYGAPKPDDLDLSMNDASNTADNSTENNGYLSANHLQINNPILIARERLLAAEAGIERRYLKPPLGFKSNTILLSSGNDEYADNANDENAPSGLIRWREAVRICDSGTQLALLLHFLESFIAWDKSIMRASCQFCNSGENEAELLLCDSCDKGYHLYCFRPKMETIPEGDWFCYECLNKNSMDKVCVICGKKGKLINCDTCPKVFHPNCLDPPVSKPQKGRWFCFACLRKSKKPMKSTSERYRGKSNLEKSLECKTPNDKSKNEINHQNTSKSNSTTKDSKKKSNKKTPTVAKETEKNLKNHAKDHSKDHEKEREKDHDQTFNDKDSSTTTKETTTTNSGKKDSKKKETRTTETKEKKSSKETKSKAEPKEITSSSKDRSKKKSAKELGTSILLEPKKADNYNPSPFELLLDDIVQHKDSWPFLNPVDTNEYPLYKNIIKKPMDFAKIKQKNDAGQYTDSELFIADCRLIFDNCETFNEDESEVVKAGRNLREFIEARWKELID